jgi:transcriptional regulator with XRE-family HTH domain
MRPLYTAELHSVAYPTAHACFTVYARSTMDSMSDQSKPFVTLGKHLRTVREQLKRSLAEVSGAVEIDERQLELIEAGQLRPEEDVMLLLISYFNVQDQEAMHLWELAQYDSDLSDHVQFESGETQPDAPSAMNGGKPMIMLLAIDVRTMYSDGLDVTVNPAGVTMQFTQTVPNTNQPTPVARLGVSHQQAELIVQTLQQALLYAKYGTPNKLLPPSAHTK